jgi:predicted RNase H-like nuclease (RuvC/YqgF family)
MLDMFKKIEEEQQKTEMNNTEPCENREENLLTLIETLGGEEQALLEEKAQLANMEEQLQLKIKEEIEAKKHRIENLKNEIPELKQRCEALAKALDIQVQK